MTQRIHAENLQALLIDVQDKLTPLIADHETVTNNIVKLIKGLKLLDVPLIANEQYPKGLGHTIAPIKEVLGDTSIFEKVTFSSCDDEPTLNALRAKDRPQVLIFGIETHEFFADVQIFTVHGNVFIFDIFYTTSRRIARTIIGVGMKSQK